MTTEFLTLTEADAIETGDRLLVVRPGTDGSPLQLRPSVLGRMGEHSFLGTFAKWATALGRGASSPARALAIGDSNVMGFGDNSGTTVLTESFARDFADLLGWLTGSILGNQRFNTNSLADYESYNATVSHSGSWTIDSSDSGVLGGRFFKLPSGASGVFTWTPDEDFDTLLFSYPVVGSNGTLVVAVDGVGKGSFSQTGSASYVTQTFTGLGAGPHTVTITGSSITGDAYIEKLEIQDRAGGTPVYCQAGWSGSKAADLATTTNAWSSLPQVAIENFDFVIYYATINDLKDGTAAYSYYASVEAFVAEASATADGVLMFGFPGQDNNNLDGLGVIVAEHLRRIARDYGWSYFDSREVLGNSNVRANALGYRYDDHHPNHSGHTALAAGLFDFLGDKLT